MHHNFIKYSVVGCVTDIYYSRRRPSDRKCIRFDRSPADEVDKLPVLPPSPSSFPADDVRRTVQTDEGFSDGH